MLSALTVFLKTGIEFVDQIGYWARRRPKDAVRRRARPAPGGSPHPTGFAQPTAGSITRTCTAQSSFPN